MRELLARGEKLMGMGHREYKIRDPRAQHLEEMAKALGEASDPRWYEIARALEDAANTVLNEVKPGRRIYANVEFYSAPPLVQPRDPERRVHLHVRVRPHGRLDGARPRTATPTTG